ESLVRPSFSSCARNIPPQTASILLRTNEARMSVGRARSPSTSLRKNWSELISSKEPKSDFRANGARSSDSDRRQAGMHKASTSRFRSVPLEWTFWILCHTMWENSFQEYPESSLDMVEIIILPPGL